MVPGIRLTTAFYQAIDMEQILINFVADAIGVGASVAPWVAEIGIIETPVKGRRLLLADDPHCSGGWRE
jgi:hypothetical protein